MDVYGAILSRRSIRRFQQKPIRDDLLKKFVDAGRLAPSAANLQQTKFFVANDKKLCSKIFGTISWAGYIKPKWTPAENERPAAYIITLNGDTKKDWNVRDVSLATENIVLTAEAEGIGSCILLKVDKKELARIIKIPENLQIDTVIALGYKDEESIVENYTDSLKYYRDEAQVMHVPKKKLEDVMFFNKF